MTKRIFYLIATLSLLQRALADIAPEITWVEEGYNFIAKLPCIGCPFLYQDTSKGEAVPWAEKTLDNALLLNFSLPYDSAFLSINTAPIHPSPTRTLPQIYANQIVQDISPADLSTLIESNQLEASHEESNLGGGFFGLSYRHSFRRVKSSAALHFLFDVTDVYSELVEGGVEFKLNDEKQKMVELVLLQKPIMSSREPPAFEIVKASLVSRTTSAFSSQITMNFQEWDAHGKKGTTSHLLSSWGTSFLDFLDSGVWPLFAFLLGVIALFVVLCLFCIFGCDWCSDDYEKAQHGKARGEKRRGRSGDVELGHGRRFESAEELGLLGRGRVVGVGKSD